MFNQKGFTVFFITILIMVAMFEIIITVTFLTFSEQKILENTSKSTIAYYIAEIGIEDALLRLIEAPGMSAISYTINTEQGFVDVDISETIGGSRTIVSQGNASDRLRKIEVIYAVNTDSISFHYGAQAGDGGIAMENNSVIHGNVFSNGTVEAVTGTATIDNSVVIAKSGNKIINLIIGTLGNVPPDEARVHTCEGSTINGNLYYVSGGSSNCTVNGGTETTMPNDIDPESMPISDSQIDNWKNEATIGGIEIGDYIIADDTEYLGPKKITGNLILENNAILMLTGNLWVVGDITINNGATLILDAGYGLTNGVVVADGKILVENGVVLEGSGDEGSYIMLLTTNDSILLNDPAIYVKNNAQGAIFYASSGMIRLRNNINIREATGYKLYLDNNAEITYESGLINALFSSGPGGSWEVSKWEEIE